MAAHKHAPELRRVNKLWALMTDSMMTDGLTEENTRLAQYGPTKSLEFGKTEKELSPLLTQTNYFIESRPCIQSVGCRAGFGG